MSGIKRQRVKRQKAEIEYFENTAKSLFQERVNKPYSFSIIECYLHLTKLSKINNILKKYILQTGKELVILNICAGSGMEAEFVFKKNPTARIIALELSKDMCLNALVRARRRNFTHNLNIICADGSRLPFKNEIAQLVLYYDGLHHIPEYKRSIREGNNILKESGFILLSEPFISRLINLIIIKLQYQSNEYFGFPTYKFLIEDMNIFFSKLNYRSISVKKMWDFYPKAIINLIERHPRLLIIYKFLDKLLNILSIVFLYCTSIILFQKKLKNDK